MNKITPVNSLVNEAVNLARQIMKSPAHALKIAKICVTRGAELGLSAALEFDEEYIKDAMSAPEAQAYFKQKKQNFADKNGKIGTN